MDRFVNGKEQKLYVNMVQRYVHKNHMLDIILPIKTSIEETTVKFLLVLSKHFPSAIFNFDDKNRPWEDFILHGIYKGIKFGESPIYFDIGLMYNIGSTVIETKISENGVSIYFDYDHNNNEILLLTFRANVFTNKNYLNSYMEDGWTKVWIDQTKSARMNRQKLNRFMIELERVLGTEISEISSSYISEKYLSKYGINDNAVLELD